MRRDLASSGRPAIYLAWQNPGGDRKHMQGVRTGCADGASDCVGRPAVGCRPFGIACWYCPEWL